MFDIRSFPACFSKILCGMKYMLLLTKNVSVFQSYVPTKSISIRTRRSKFFFFQINIRSNFSLEYAGKDQLKKKDIIKTYYLLYPRIVPVFFSKCFPAVTLLSRFLQTVGN